MIKKSKDYPQKIAEKIQSVLDFNKENPKSPQKTLEIEISKGLFNCGSVALRNNVCSAFNIASWELPFIFNVKCDGDYYSLLITFIL